MHFKLDENVPVGLKSLLMSLGYEATTVFEEDISGIDDKKIISLCKKREFVLITLDTDFSNIFSYPSNSHCGIVVIRTKEQGAKSVVSLFQKLLDFIDINKSKNSIIIIDKESIKIRR